MQVLDIPVEELTPYENNPRNNEAAVAAVAASIENFGFKVPLVIDKNNVIVCGHTRYKAALQLGYDTVPAIMADDLTEEQVQAFRLADNKTAEIAEWDFEKLNEELAALSDFDMQQFGFEPTEDDGGEITEDDAPEPDEENEPETKLGDIFQLGTHRLICGDSTDPKVLARLTEGAEMDLVLTDPPYNVAYEGKTKDALTIQNDKKTEKEFFTFLKKAFDAMHGAAKQGAAAYIFHANLETVNFMTAFQAAGFKLSEILIWVKSNFALGHFDYHWRHEPILYGWKEGSRHYFRDTRVESTVIDDRPNINGMSKAELKAYVKELLAKEPASSVIYEDKPARNADHPTMKPVKLVAYLIRNSSIAGESVLDPFGGSGSTLIACEQTNRRCYTAELDPRYCDVIIKRWERLTGEKAVLINGATK